MTCDRCAKTLSVGEWPFCDGHGNGHGQMTLVVEPDSIPGGMTVEHLGPTPRTFYSKTEWRDAMRAEGVVNKVRHVGLPGSDRSPHTTRWI